MEAFFNITGDFLGAASLFSFLLPVCDPMHNRNNEFILIIYIVRRKMTNFKRRELEIGLEFGRLSFAKRNNFSEGSSKPKKYAQVIRVWGAAAPQVFKLELLVFRILVHLLNVSMCRKVQHQIFQTKLHLTKDISENTEKL